MPNYDINADPARAELSMALYGLIENAMDDLTSRDDVYSYDTDPSAIPSQGYDGFIPYTNGGWSGTVLANMSYAQGSGCIPRRLRPYLEQAEKDASEGWLREHGGDYGYDPESGEDAWDFLYRLDNKAWEARESFYDYQDDWLTEGGTYFYKVRAMVFAKDNPRNETGEDEVYILAAINLDFEYGREHEDDILYGRTFRLSELTDEVLDEVQQDIAKAVGTA